MAKTYAQIACTQEITGVPEQILLLPIGPVHSQNGDFLVDQQSFNEMQKCANTRGIDIVIDYEHQSLSEEQAPAAGWIKGLSLQPDGVHGQVEWTPKAAAYLQNREYKYLSPVVLVREADRRAVRMPSAALTNLPAIDGMRPIVNAYHIKLEKGADQMELLQKLAGLLGLGEDATEQQVCDELTRLTGVLSDLQGADKTELVANKTVLGLLALKEGATTADVTAQIVRLQNSCREIAGKMAAQEGAQLVELALKEGKITPPQKEWAEGYAQSDLDGFKSFLEKAVPVVPLEQLQLSSKPGSAPMLTEAEQAVMRQLGLDSLTAKGV